MHALVALVLATALVAPAALAQSSPPEALARLEAIVAHGIRFNPADAAWDSLREDPRFKSLESEMRARTAPLVRSTTAFLLEKDLIPENIAHDLKAGSFFVGSMYKAKIIRIAPDGNVSDFVPSRRDGLLSVLGMKVDAERRELWAVAGNFVDSPPMQTPDPASHGKGAIFRFDIDTGVLKGRYEGPGGSAKEPMTFNDLVISPGGDVYATAGPRGIWRLRRDADAVEPFIEPKGSAFNGIAITPDGKSLFAASHREGVLKVDIPTRKSVLVEVPRNVTIGGIDGLYFHEGSLVGIQNGTNPQRVVRAWLNPEMTRVTRFVVLEQDHPLWDIPLTGTIIGDHLYYVARSQLRAFEKGVIWPADRLKETVILELPLEPPGPAAVDLEETRRSLLDMHRREIRAHLDRDAAWIGDTTSDEMITVNGGKIARVTRESVRDFFNGYFEGADYLQYDDAEPPIVAVSDDGSMGWIISRTRVRRTQKGAERSFVYAGIMTYQRRGRDWIRVANVSTFE